MSAASGPKTGTLGGIEVGPILLGCGTFGGIGSPPGLIGKGLDEAAAHAVMDEAVTLGVDVFDTACSYAGGDSERFIARWLADQAPDVVERIRIATKVGLVSEGGSVRVDLSPATLRRQFEGSLERLQADRVEFLLTHAPDDGTPVEATLEALGLLIEAGRVGRIGACNLSVGQLEAALDASERRQLPRYEWIQNEYNLLHRSDETRLFGMCTEHGLGFTPFSPLAGGVLTGKYRRGVAPPAGSRLALRPEGRALDAATFDALEKLEALARSRSVSPGALALAWVLRQPAVTAVVVGPSRNAEHLRLAREALAVELDDADEQEIGRWFPCPGPERP